MTPIELLREIEWIWEELDGYDDQQVCPRCGHNKADPSRRGDGHTADCDLAKLLRENPDVPGGRPMTDHQHDWVTNGEYWHCTICLLHVREGHEHLVPAGENPP